MKFKKVLLLALLCSSVLVGCEEHPSFKTSVDAVEGCKKELAELKEMDDVSVENLAKATSAWLSMGSSEFGGSGQAMLTKAILSTNISFSMKKSIPERC